MDFDVPSYYFNRELSWLEFNERVLEEAQDISNPLMERLKFLAITASNLDEFFMVRVSSIWEQESAGKGQDASGLTPMQQLSAISERVHTMTADQYACFTQSLLPALAREGIRFLGYSELDGETRAYVDRYFENTVFPVLTPMAIDRSRPFPLLNNRTVNLFIELEGEDDEPLFAVVQVPTVLPRILALSKESHLFLDEVMLAHVGKLFPGHKVLQTSLLRVTRNSDLVIDEEEMDDLLGEMERSIKRRRWGDPVRIEISREMSGQALTFLEKALDLEKNEIYDVPGPLDLSVLMSFSGGSPKLRYKPMNALPAPAFLNREQMFDVIRERDVLVRHPFTAFDCVVRFVREAAADPQVLAIKQTLYRVSGQSPVVAALMQAAENGKQVTVIVELRARFDEENNINWAKMLERSGCHVVYGLAGLKTHCKICLVVRREDDGIRRYVHLGTGNYNDATAKIYVDSGYFTCKEAFGQDCSMLFNTLTGYSKDSQWKKIAVAPVTLRKAFLRLIETEAANAKEGKPSGISVKMNSLSDAEIIQALYRASRAGVEIRLLIRGICCLKAGLPGVSENIEVSSIVDRFLEHDRILYFENAGSPKLFLSSADWMPRNLDRRVEVLFPIEDADLKRELTEILALSFSDNIKRRVQQPNGQYKKTVRKGRVSAVRSQFAFYERVERVYDAAKEMERRDAFRPNQTS
jgi:polyphosphate kinase